MPAARLSRALSLALRQQCGLDPAAHLQLLQNIRHIVLDRLFRQEDPLPNLPIGQAEADQAKNLLLAVSQFLKRIRCRPARERRQHLRCQGRRHVDLATERGLQYRVQLLRRDALQDIGANPGLEGSQQCVVVFGGRQQDGWTTSAG